MNLIKPHAPAPAALPNGGPVWRALVLIAGGLLAFGVYCFAQQTQHGFIVTGLRMPGYGGAAWGLYVAFDVFFVGVSFAGITVAAMTRLFSIETLRPVTRLAELITISALLAGGCVIVSDLGRPLDGLLKLPRYANPHSPFYGTFTLVVAGYLFSSLVYFFLAGRADAARMAQSGPEPLRRFYRLWASGWRGTAPEHERHEKTSFWLSLTILPLLVTAHSTLGFIFGIQAGRPGWYSALQAPAFVILAGVSGTGILILAALGLRRLFRLREQIPDASIRWLGNFMWVLMLVYIYFMVVDELTATYAGPASDRHVAHEIVGGAFAPHFWVAVGSFFLAFAIPFVCYVRGITSVRAVGVAAVFANVGAVLKRLLLVVPSQTHGAPLPMEHGPFYTPTWVEVGIVVGLCSLIALVLLIFFRLFPLVPSHGEVVAASAARRRPDGRGAATVLVAMTALAMIVTGLTDSFRLWSHGENDPRIPYSPVVFASGVMLLFTSAIVYETWGWWRGRREPG
jgi:dimethyl sulfoxide reductase membrane subunit